MDYEQSQHEPANDEQPQPQGESTATPRTTPENPWVETLKTIGLAAFLAFGIRIFVAEARYIPSGSMLPTLQINDRLIIDKVSYHFANPVRGDIVVFNPTAKLEEEKEVNPITNKEEPKYREAFIKRVIGVPGDRIEVKNGKVYINGKVLTEKYIDEAPLYKWSSTSLTPDGVVPEGHYLVLGDNRNNSYDSHYWGFVPKDKIVGKAIVRFWPINRAGGINPQPDYQGNGNKN